MRPAQRAVACALLACACMAGAQVQERFPPSHPQLGGNLALVAATVVEGGGATGRNPRGASAVVEVSEEFAGQFVPPWRLRTGAQPAAFRILPANRGEEQEEFRVPADGKRFLAFVQPGEPLVVYANYVYADTPENRATVRRGRAPPPGSEYQGPLYSAALAMAVIAMVAAWIRWTWGASALGAAVVAWIAYEATVPTQVNIRVDLLVLLPLMAIALGSVAFAGFRQSKGRD